MKRTVIILGAILLIALLFGKGGLKKNSISGYVYDSSGNPVAKAKVEARVGSKLVAKLKTNQKGWFIFLNLDQDYYKIKVSAKGFEDWSTELDLLEGAPEMLEVHLTPIVKKVKRSPGANAAKSQGAVDGGLTELQSGVTSVGGGLHIRGGRANEVYYTVDGFQQHETEDYSAIKPNIYHSPLNEPLSTFSIDVDTATYSNVRRMLNNSQLPPANSVRVEELVNYFDYDYPQPKDEHPFAVYTEYGICPWNTEHRLVHIGLQGKDLNLEKAIPSNLVFLIDVSGSMDEPNKLGLVQRSLNLLVDNMRAEDRIAIVVYASSTGLVLPSTSGEDKARIKDAINALTAGGSTAGGAGIQLAYKTAEEYFIKEGNNRVILCTDG
ncbi:MAG TPA: von Willebrand factor type A domain-containing protein, partial [Candidatus Cloacimonadota bacterium]|nr:von Willebrand factor type A domain-containing protein [Candidatus Cloacimonadota bacterium]